MASATLINSAISSDNCVSNNLNLCSSNSDGSNISITSNNSTEIISKTTTPDLNNNKIQNNSIDNLINEKCNDKSIQFNQQKKYSEDNFKNYQTSLYQKNATEIKVINSECIVYFYCTDVDIAIEDHFKRALNPRSCQQNEKPKDLIEVQQLIPMTQRNLPPSFWNSNYYSQHNSQQTLHNIDYQQSSLISDHANYQQFNEPVSSLQPLLQLETLSQLTHLQQNHSQNSSVNFPSQTQHSQLSSQNSSLINNPINSLTFAHHLQNTSNNNYNLSSHHNQQAQQNTQQINNNQTTTHLHSQIQHNQSTDLTQPQFLHHLLQQNNHFQYSQTSLPNDTSHSLFNPQNHLNNSFPNQLTHNSQIANYNGQEAPNNWSPSSAFIPLASPASSSSCSSNVENNGNRPNKLINSINSSSKPYDLAKPTAKFNVSASDLLQLNSTGTSPNRSPTSTTTLSPVQVSHNSNTLSPVTFSNSNNSSYQLNSVEKQRNSNISNFFPSTSLTNTNSVSQPSVQSNLSVNTHLANTTSNNSVQDTIYSSSTNASSPLVSTTTSSCNLVSVNSVTAKPFNHFASQSSPEIHSTWTQNNNHQAYLTSAFHSPHNLSYHPASTNNTQVATNKMNSENNSSSYQYNSLLLQGSTHNSSEAIINMNSSLSPKASIPTNNLQHSLTNSTMPSHLSNYNYYQLNQLNQINSLNNSSADSSNSPSAISFHHHNTANFHHHHHHHHQLNANYNGYNNYSYGLSAAMTGFDNQVTDGPAKDLYWF